MLQLHSLEDFKELLGDSRFDLEEYGCSIEKLYENYREPGKEVVELNWHDVQDLLELVRQSSSSRGREEGFQSGIEQSQY